MPRKDVLSGALDTYRVTIETMLGKSRVTLRATSDKGAADLVVEAFGKKFPKIPFELVEVRKVEDRPLPTNDK